MRKSVFVTQHITVENITINAAWHSANVEDGEEKQ